MRLKQERETTAKIMNIELLNSKENTYGVGHWVHEHGNQLLSKCFLRAALNLSKSMIFRRSFGSAFHTCRTGAAYTKERSPYDFVVIEGTTNKFFVPDLKLMYESVCMKLVTLTNILGLLYGSIQKQRQLV